MPLSDQVHIARRFLRSINIESDFGDPKALEGFVCPKSSAEVLLTMVQHVTKAGQGAFTWTGPYGGGKSSLIVVLCALLSGNSDLQKQAAKVLGNKLADEVSRALPPGKNGWRIVPVMGRRDHPIQVIGEALNSYKVIERRLHGDWTESKLVDAVVDVSNKNSEEYGGLILVVDEMGKFLEAATQDGADIYIFQRLAEAAARSGGRLLFVGILHQAFEEYAHRLSNEARDEWAKIQGRFVDLGVNVAGSEQLDLISRAIESSHRPKTPSTIAYQVAGVLHRERTGDSKELAQVLESCWPLHPATACLLGPVSRRRFGQNQRSVFGFLNSAEPHGFQDFLHHADAGELFCPDSLWSYLRVNFEPSILASPDGHRWALAAAALERCEAKGGELLHLRLLKTIGIVDLFKERSGLVASLELLRACLPKIPDQKIKKALAQLQKWSCIIFKKFIDAYAIYAGSDFDIEQAVQAYTDSADEVDFSALKDLAGLQPILAKRHYHETGALRWFDVNLVPVHSLPEAVGRFKPTGGTIGKFLLAMPIKGEKPVQIDKLISDAVRDTDEWDLVVGTSKQSLGIITFARELIALEKVRNNHPELAGDDIARREVTARLAALQGHLEAELYKAFDDAIWFKKLGKPAHYRQADLCSLASDLADKRFDRCPKLHNELLNRQKPSGSAISAQNILLRSMVLQEGTPRLGIVGFPAEGGLFASTLVATGLYKEGRNGWQFFAPKTGDSSRLAPIWEAAEAFLKENTDRTVAISEICDLWRQQPFGVKDGLMPVLAVAFILSQRDRVAVYRDGTFRAKFNDLDVDNLAKNPATVQLRWMDLSKTARQLLSELAEVVRSLDPKNQLVHLEPIDVARGLVAIYEDLPTWTKRTALLSENAMRVRELFKRAHDPNQFLFNDIPVTLGGKARLTSQKDPRELVGNIREGLEELSSAFLTSLHRLRDLMLSELLVPNNSPKSLMELRTRAENIRQLAGDFHLEAFIGRLSVFDGTDLALEDIVSLIANKPPRDWADSDLDRAMINVSEMTQFFLRTETYGHLKGRPSKRQAMALIIRKQGVPQASFKEFGIKDTDKIIVENLINQIDKILQDATPAQMNIVFAVITELGAKYINLSENQNPKGKKVEI